MHCSKLGAGQVGEMGVTDYLLLVRGNTILNSVKIPGSVSTSMLPPCCLTTMSWLIDRPSPVPSPEGLVVKNGLNIFSLTSSGIPMPLSRIRISTLSPRFFVIAASVGSKPSPDSAFRFVAA
jgi:hypothetical protein